MKKKHKNDESFFLSKAEVKKKQAYYRISKEEFQLICKTLKRPPKGIEWALFSALWNEHCSYKSSKIHLKKFFPPSQKSSKVIKSFGENAGVINLGQGEKIAFKIESHNHPSFIDPFQGAATGVGGILRDVFTMGARPIAIGNYLCFGSPKKPFMRHLIQGVVHGISRYGNSVGIPTLTGQTEFHSSYENNILVNALALGLFLPGDPITSSKAKGVGNYVIYVGAKTGRDGLHGASMASESLKSENLKSNAQKNHPLKNQTSKEDTESSVSSRPLKSTVQIGDPFLEKLLIESTLEVIQKRLVVAIQDMGAAGLLSSSFEMASKGNVGLNISLNRVPLRDSTLEAEEILISESQERMLLICKPKNFKKLKSIFNRWNLEAEIIGTVEKEKKITLFWKDKKICQINPDLLVKKAPLYKHPFKPYKKTQKKINPLKRKNALFLSLNQKKDPSFLKSLKKTSKFQFFKLRDELKFFLLQILQNEMGCSRNWIYQQYDQRIGGKTLSDASNNVSILKLPHSKRLLSLVLGGRPHLMRMDPREGGIDSLFYPHLELATQGFKSLAATNCLNFGNPTNQKVMSEFVACLEGMSETSKALNIPIVSGNVSFHNETKSKKTSITSTPATGLTGLRQSRDSIPLSYFVNENEDIFLVGLPELKFAGLFKDFYLENMDHLLENFKKNSIKTLNTPYAFKNSFQLLDQVFLNQRKLKNKKVGFLNPKTLNIFSNLILHLSQKKWITSSRVVGKFGLLYTLSRMSIGKEEGEESKKDLKEIGCEIEDTFFDSLLSDPFLKDPLSSKNPPRNADSSFLHSKSKKSKLTSNSHLLLNSSLWIPRFFTETLYQVIYCVPPFKSQDFVKTLKDFASKNTSLKNVECLKIGKTKGSSLKINSFLNIPLKELKNAYKIKKKP